MNTEDDLRLIPGPPLSLDQWREIGRRRAEASTHQRIRRLCELVKSELDALCGVERSIEAASSADELRELMRSHAKREVASC